MYVLYKKTVNVVCMRSLMLDIFISNKTPPLMIFKGGFPHLHTATDYSHYLSAPPPPNHTPLQRADNSSNHTYLTILETLVLYNYMHR